jgi:hypothetical protein
MTDYVTVDDVLASAKKWGDENVLTWNPTETRDAIVDNKNKNKKPYDCAWATLKVKTVDEKLVVPNIKFKKIVSSSQVKLPPFNKDGDVKNMQICFNKVTREEVAKSGYTDDALIDELTENTNQFAEMIQIFNKSYHKICDEIKECKTLHFSIRKDKKVKTNKDVHVYSITQLYREDKDGGPDAEPIKLEIPLTRLKLMIRKEDGMVGVSRYNSVKKEMEFKPNDYDIRKMTKKNNYASVLATVKRNGKIYPLDKDNAEEFLTYRSIFGGFIIFKDITISKIGMTLSNQFGDIFVKSNKNNISEPTLSKNDLADLIGNGQDSDSEDSDDGNDVADVEVKLENTKITENKIESDLEDVDENSNLDSDLEDD